MATDIQKERLKKLGRFLAVKVPIIIAIIIIMMIVSLKLVERYPDPLRQGFEDYLSRTYGSTATIGQLERVQFFPNIVVTARDVTMHNRSNAAVIDIAVDYIDIEAPFTSMIFGTGKIKNLDIRNLTAAEHFILPKALDIKNLSIAEENGPEQYGAFLTADGKYAGQKMSLQAELEKSGNLYKVGQSIPFSLSLGGAVINAQMVKERGGKVLLKNTVYTASGKETEARDYILAEQGEFKKDNPLTCLIDEGAVNQCQEFFK